MIDFLKEKRVKIIGCGWNYSIAIDSKGFVWTWGYGKDNALGRDTTDDSLIPDKISLWTLARKNKRVSPESEFEQIKSIACGSKHVLALSIDGDVYSWGRGEFGRLGHGDTESKSHPYIIEDLMGKNVTAIAAGGYHSGAMNGIIINII